MEWTTKEFPCPHLNPFDKDQNKESKFLNPYGVEEKYLQKDFKFFNETYNSVKNKQKKIMIIPAEKMDAEVISAFIISKVKEETFSKKESRDTQQPCTSSAVTKMNIDTDENDDDDEVIDDKSVDEDTQKDESKSPLGKKSKIESKLNAKLKKEKINSEKQGTTKAVSKLEKNEDDDDRDV